MALCYMSVAHVVLTAAGACHGMGSIVLVGGVRVFALQRHAAHTMRMMYRRITLG
jgi:hypothetical protein